MKALVCDLCGSNDVVKDGEYFVCQNCGTKYTVETARKMMFEGSVTIDNSQQVANYVTLAKRAISEGEDPKKYIDKALELNPNNPEILTIETHLLKEKCTKEAELVGRSCAFSACIDDEEWTKLLERRVRLINRLNEEDKKETVDQLFSSFITGVRYARVEFDKTGMTTNYFTEDGYTRGVPSLSSVENSIRFFHTQEYPNWEALGVRKDAIDEVERDIFDSVYHWLVSRCNNYFSGRKTGYRSLNMFIKSRNEIVSLLTMMASLTSLDSMKIRLNELLIEYIDSFPAKYESGEFSKPVPETTKEENRQLIKEAWERIEELDPSRKPKKKFSLRDLLS